MQQGPIKDISFSAEYDIMVLLWKVIKIINREH